MMKEFTCGMAAGMAVSAAVAMACMPKKSNARKRISQTMKSMVDFVDDLGDAFRA